MPILKHAKKKLRQDKKRTTANKRVKDSYKKAFKVAVKLKSAEALSKAFKAIDKAAKQNLIHQNKAGRLKSSLSKLIPSPAGAKTKSAEKTATKPPVAKKPTVKKAAAKPAKK